MLYELEHNTRVKQYPDGSQLVTVSDRSIFREPGWELSDKWDSEPRALSGLSDREGESEDRERARRRARAAVADLGRSNRFSLFVTLTLDGSKVDRYDPSITCKELRRWLSHQVQRRGLVYVLVPELHQDGAIHFHGLVNDVLPRSDSGTIKREGHKKPQKPRSRAERDRWIAEGGQVVYNLPGWPYGFTTALELQGDYRRAVAYVCKYIGKDSRKIGGRWYYSGGDLRRPEITYSDTDYAAMQAAAGCHEYTIPRLAAKCINIDLEG